MKAHLAIVKEPIGSTGIEPCLCGFIGARAHVAQAWEGEATSMKERLANVRGLCRKCLKKYLDRVVRIEPNMREWVYAIAEGDPEL